LLENLYENMKKDNFPLFLRGDIILTNNHKSLFARLIRFAGRLGGSNPEVNHVEMYLGNGTSFSADAKMCKHDIERYFQGKHDVYFYRCIVLSEDDRNKLSAESQLWEGKPYDVLGIFWQALDAITGNGFSRKYNTDMLAYCSELIQRIYWKIKRRVSKKVVGEATPDDIRIYISQSKIWRLVFSIRKIGNEWVIKVPDVKFKPEEKCFMALGE